MLSRQEEERERRAVLQNDQLVQAERRRVFAPNLPRQSSTLHQHAIADADTPRGRFSAVSAAYVVGSTPTPATAYPAASAHPVPDEPPLGYRIDAMPDLEPSALSSCSAEQTGPTSVDAPSPLAGQRGVGSFSSEMVAQRMSQMASSSSQGDDVRVERPPAFRRF